MAAHGISSENVHVVYTLYWTTKKDVYNMIKMVEEIMRTWFRVPPQS
jgi:hypothetical protein